MAAEHEILYRDQTNQSTDLDRQTFSELMQRSQEHELLSRKQEQALGHKVQTGLAVERSLADQERPPTLEEELVLTEGLAAREEFMLANLRLVGKEALNFYNRHPAGHKYGLMDIYNDGIVSLNHAITKFDPDSGFKFSTYAVWWIKQGIDRSIADKAYQIRVPVNRVSEVRKIQLMRGAGLGDEEIMRRTGFTPEKLEDIDQVRGLNEGMLYLDAEYDDAESPLGDFVVGSHLDLAEAEADIDLPEDDRGELYRYLGAFLKDRHMKVIASVQEDSVSHKHNASNARLWSKLKKGIMRHPAIAGKIALISGIEPSDIEDYQDWRKGAACKTSTNEGIDFVQTKTKITPETKQEMQKICASCTKYQDCLADVAEYRPEMGFWAGVYRGLGKKGSYHSDGTPVTLEEDRGQQS